MRRTLVAFSSGLLFGAGLLLSRMADPAKVLNFLDFTVHWDPSLAFVMVGGIAVAAVGFFIARRMAHPLFGTSFPSLPFGGVTAKLLAGAALFGTGWGLLGLCPGPAIVALPLDPTRVIVFIIPMLAGMWGVRTLAARAEAGKRQPLPVGTPAVAVQNNR
ncbi:DUF6691 family protein [Acidiphilium acidophilum]|uniref:DUF6691 family protein n=1 Tax=Acidiphilium acidophilum TaxID=76588 RepID=A0AAW9DNT2_ACIAO|nr:DUF6691 family protein [Acidiphilium acidophilum]MDX5930731.1 DUF6691 family protein [Acidiphilium acidophilum]GBQ20686.1 hypothetical protein AA700_1383 [Acidiphilium acidophilum DSM 700]